MIISPDRISNTQEITDDSFIPLGDGIEFMLPVGAKDGDAWEITVEPFQPKKKLASAILSDQVFLTNKETLLSTINNNLVITNNDTANVVSFLSKPDKATPNFSSDKIVQFFNHIFMVIGKTLYWTDLDSYLNWYPDTNNEADFREMEGEIDDASAIVRVNDILYLHFPQTIYSVEYVGKPTVVRILARAHGVGAISQSVIQSHQSLQFFLGIDNFYLYSGAQGQKAIGDEVWRNFNRDCENYSDVWSYLDLLNNEVCWVTGSYIYAFNYKEGHWQRYENTNLHSHIVAPWLKNSTTIESYNVESDSIIESNKIKGLENLWLIGDGVYREQRIGDDKGTLLISRNPMLESDDMSFGDIFNTKTVNSISFDARYDSTYDGIKCYVSARDAVTEKVNWVYVGTWRDEDPNQRITFPGLAGKILKFKFEIVVRRNLHNGERNFNGGQLANGNFREVADGTFKFDGEKTAIGKDVPRYDGLTTFDGVRDEPLGYFEINAWGENVDPPKRTGPDK